MRVLHAVSMLGFGTVLGCSAVNERSSGWTYPVGIDGGGGGGASTTAVCPYPPGPYGIATGSPVAPSLKWQGFLEEESQPSEVPVTDFQDCDGSKGLNAVLFDLSATWCGACQQEATELPARMAAWKGEGIRVVTLMVQDGVGSPATIATAEQWKQSYKLDPIVTLADPAASLAPKAGALGLPYQIILDPRTMKITSTQEGYSGDYSALLSLAAQNHP